MHYKNEIEQIPGLQIVPQPSYSCNNNWMVGLLVDESIYGLSSTQVMKKLADHNIQTRPLWYPNHLQKPYRQCQTFRVEETTAYWHKALNLPCSVDLSVEQRQSVIDVLRNEKR